MSTEIEAIGGDFRDLSEAIRVGQWVFLSGQCALDDDDQVVGVGDMEAQVRHTFKQIGDLLEQVGASWSDVVKTSKIFKEFTAENVAIYQRVRHETMGPRYPATI